MANTFNAETLCNYCCQVALNTVCQILAPLNNFANDCSGDPMAPLRPVIVPVVTTTSAVQTIGATPNFSTGAAGAMRGITIVPEHLSIPYSISSKELNQGYRLEQLVSANAQKFAAAIWSKVLALIVNDATTPAVPPVAFPSGNKVIQAIATFGPSAVGDIYGKLLCGPKHLILDPVAVAKLMYVPGGCCQPLASGVGGLGFASISEHSLWTGGQPNLYGFGYCREAIVIVSGIPAASPACADMLDQRTITLPGIGLTIQVNTWCDLNSRSVIQTLDIVFGAALGVPCQGVTLLSA
jgi:hypothetical protein